MKTSIIMLLISCCWFASPHSMSAAQQLPSRDVYVVNPLDRTMKFTIICGSGHKKESTKHELKPLIGELYKCTDWKSSPVLSVVTEHKKPVLVKLEPQKRYEFYWNSDKSQWEVHEITPRT